MPTHNFSRRDALKFFAATSAGLLLPASAWAVTQDDINKTNQSITDAQTKLDAVQAELEQLGNEYQALSEQQAQTLAQIDDKKAQIATVQTDIDEKEVQLAAQREVLARRMRSAYKSGGNDFLSILLSSGSFEELTSNVYYLSKITQNDHDMIAQVDALKIALTQQKTQLEQEQADLESLNATQQQQLAQMQAKQAEVQTTIEGLSQDVKDLMAQRDSELQAMAAEKAAQEAAARAAASRGGSVSGGNANISYAGTTGSQAAVLQACTVVPSPGNGLCAMWVSQVFSRAGYPYASGNANDMYNAWTTTSDRGAIKPGMIIATPTHPHTLAGRIYGHIGIYVGNNTVMDNIGYIRSSSLDSWISYYSASVYPRWGWLMGIKLA